MNDKCPCIDCICIPICRHKGYVQLFDECELAHDYEPEACSYSERDELRVEIIEETLKPSKWSLTYEHGEVDYKTTKLIIDDRHPKWKKNVLA